VINLTSTGVCGRMSAATALAGMLRTDCSRETRLALHAPSLS